MKKSKTLTKHKQNAHGGTCTPTWSTKHYDAKVSHLDSNSNGYSLSQPSFKKVVLLYIRAYSSVGKVVVGLTVCPEIIGDS